jgi:hypothetical protein
LKFSSRHPADTPKENIAKAWFRVRAKINSQIVSVQAPAQQGAKTKEYQAYSVFSQRR